MVVTWGGREAVLDGHDSGVKYLIWDFDGTLAYRPKGWMGALLAVLGEEMPRCEVDRDALHSSLRTGFPWHVPDKPHPELVTADCWWEGLTPVLIRAFEAVGVDVATALISAERLPRVYADTRHWRLYEDTVSTLRLLSSLGWTHLVLSNHVPELGGISRGLGLDRYVARVFNSAESGYEKPNPRAFDGVLQATAGAEAVWMIGDSVQADVAGAESVGIPAILVRKRHDGVERCCRDLAGIPAIVGGWRGPRPATAGDA